MQDDYPFIWSRRRQDRALVEQIKAALGTQENGEALIEVVRNAHKAELKLAKYYRLRQALNVANSAYKALE